MFDNPYFTVWNVTYTAIGAAVLWGTWGRQRLKPFIFSNIIRLFFSGPKVYVIEFITFMIVGCVVGIGLTKPINPQQAFTAGLAWTGALARPDNESKR